MPTPDQPSEKPTNAATVESNQVTLVRADSPTFGRWISWLGWMGLLLCLPIILGMYAARKEYFDRSHGVREKYHSLSKTAAKKVAILHVTGIIGQGDGYVKNQIDRIREDKHVQAVVVRIDSPGGTITGSDYIYHHLRKLCEDREIPLVVSMGGLAASGGYYVAMAVGDEEDTIFAEPTTTTGSIGVIIPHYDLSRLLSEYGVEDDSIVSHPRKQLLSMTRPASPEDREILQRYVDQAFERFKDIVRSGRPQFRADPEILDQLATGEIFAADQALESGLIDRIGFIETAIDRALELSGVSSDAVRVVEYSPPATLLSALQGATRSPAAWPRHMTEIPRLLEGSVPRAYYLLTTVPPLVRS